MGGRVGDTSTNNDGIRVLVVEANAKEAAAVRNALKASSPNFIVSPARQLWSASQILAGMPIDAVVLGLQLPDSEGFSALTELREQSPDTPLLILAKDQALAAEAVEAGADDFLMPDEIDSKTIGARILDAIERRQQQVQVEPTPEPSPEEHTASILVVEEDPWVQRLLRRNLTRQGHQVEVVSSPQAALAWTQHADTDTLDLLICDVNTPGMEGARLSRHLLKQFPDMLTLLVSAQSQQPEVIAERPQAFGFLAKPYALEDFEEAVEELLSRAPAAPASAATQS